MKKILTTIAAAFVAVTMSAQVYVGGTLGFQSKDVNGGGKKEAATTFTINPEVGYNLDDAWAVGINLGYTTTNLSGNHKLSDNVSEFSFNPYVRYTFAKLDMVNFFADGMVSGSIYDDGEDKLNSWGIGIQPGVAVNLNDKVSFVAKLGKIGYSSKKWDYDGAKALGQFDFSLSSLAALNFGLYFNF